MIAHEGKRVYGGAESRHQAASGRHIATVGASLRREASPATGLAVATLLIRDQGRSNNPAPAGASLRREASRNGAIRCAIAPYGPACAYAAGDAVSQTFRHATALQDTFVFRIAK